MFQYKDHLGNIRLSCKDVSTTSTPNLEIVEENNYYPFGLKHKGYNNVVSPNSNSVASKFKYNGTELEESLGLNLYEMDLRQYDPAIARWTSIDPVTHHSMSTYTAFDNNPVYWADPSGADSWSYDWDSNDGTYVNNSTGERSKDYKLAIYQTQIHFSKDSGSERAYTYYVGGNHYDGSGLLGHTSVGYSGSYDNNDTTLYAPLSGNSEYREEKTDYDGEKYSGVSEANTIKAYLDMGEIVERYHYSLPEKVMRNFAIIIEGELKNPGSADGSWCTLQAIDVYRLAFLSAGYSEEEAHERATEIINYRTPQELSKRQILNSGSTRYDRFYKKDGKYYQEINAYDMWNMKPFSGWSKSTIEIKF